MSIMIRYKNDGEKLQAKMELDEVVIVSTIEEPVTYQLYGIVDHVGKKCLSCLGMEMMGKNSKLIWSSIK